VLAGAAPASGPDDNALVLVPADVCWLHAHAFNETLNSACNTQPDQEWVEINGQRWTNLEGQIVDVAELQLVNTSWCINWADGPGTPEYGAFYLDSCDYGDDAELFWVQPVSGENYSYYINAFASDFFDQWIYMDPAQPANSTIIGTPQSAARPWDPQAV
jgi:hypothetical protein